MQKIFYSRADTKMKFVFDIIDSNNDGKISLKDIEIILLHIPIAP